MLIDVANLDRDALVALLVVELLSALINGMLRNTGREITTVKHVVKGTLAVRVWAPLGTECGSTADDTTGNATSNGGNDGRGSRAHLKDTGGGGESNDDSLGRNHFCGFLRLIK